MIVSDFSESIKFVGVDDREIDLFEGQYKVPDGVSYNSYVIFDEKIAVTDSVDAHKVSEWLTNVENALQGKTPDYLIVHHLEPDHAGGFLEFIKKSYCKMRADKSGSTCNKNGFTIKFYIFFSIII